MSSDIKFFDWVYYLKKNLDVAKDYNDENGAKYHFYLSENPENTSEGPGIKEGRLFNPLLEKLIEYGVDNYIKDKGLKDKRKYDIFLHYLKENDKPLIHISIGNVCNSSIYCTNNKLKPTKKEGYKTCPFDLMVSNINGIIKCFNEDFKDFYNPNFLKFNDPDSLIHTKYGFAFNHEVPVNKMPNGSIKNIYEEQEWEEGPHHFIKDNYKNFIKRYTDRINNLKYYCNNYKINFVLEYYYDKQNTKQLNDLKNAIKNRYPNLIFDILII